MSVNAVMAQTFLPGVTNRNTGVRSKFSIRRRNNHALGVTLGRYIITLINLVCTVITGKSQASVWDFREISGIGLRFPCNDLTLALTTCRDPDQTSRFCGISISYFCWSRVFGCSCVTKHDFLLWAQRKPNTRLEICKAFQDRLTFLNRHMIV